MDEQHQSGSDSGRRSSNSHRSHTLMRRARSGATAGRLILIGVTAALLLMLGLFGWALLSPEDSSNESVAVASSGPAPITPSPATPAGAAATEIYQSLGGVHASTDNVRRQLRRLEQGFEQAVNQPTREIVLSKLFAAKFRGTGIDRVRFSSRLEGPNIQVGRWSHSDSAPDIDPAAGVVSQLTESLFEPWLNSNGFRIDLKLYSFEVVDETINATVLASVFGDVSDQEGRQATSLWKTTWSEPKSSPLPLLNSLTVIAQEEVVTQLGGGQLLKDCTASVLRRCPSYPQQLQFGIDQWARRIPGIDILGEHGVAVGDLNGDGMDDIFVCQPHGLPNLLLLQNPDGTCDEVAQAAGVDILDTSYAALIIDIDNDRDQDLVVSTDENLLLFSNSGNGTFQIEHRLPVGRSARSLCAADYDQDGDLDLYLCKFEGIRKRDDLIVIPKDLANPNDGGRNVLLRNDEGWQFTDATTEAGLGQNNNQFTRSAIWSDYDQDGDQDLYVVNEFASDRLYKNEKGWMRDVTNETGIASPSRHRTVSCGDFNHDGKTDFYVATDAPFSVERSFGAFDRNSEPRDLRDAMTGDSHIWYAGDTAEAWRPFTMRPPIFANESAYGSVATDLNNDGLEDIIVTNGTLSRHSTDQVDGMLYRRLFSDPTTNPDSSATTFNPFKSPTPNHAAQIIRETTDMCRTGYSFAGQQRNQCFLSIGQLGFANFSAASGVDFLQDGRGIATTDWDQDGDEDVIVSSRNGTRLRVLRNQLKSDNAFLQLALEGTQSNADAIGTRVLVHLKDKPHPIVKSVSAGSGYLSQSSKRLTFGLGLAPAIENVTVVWPNGDEQTFSDIRPNLCYQIVEGTDSAAELTSDRLNVSITSGTSASRDQLPKVGKCLFYPPGLVPELEIVEPDERTYPVLGVNPDSATMLIVVNENSASKTLVQSLEAAADAWREQRVNCIAMTIDTAADRGNTNPTFGRTMMDDANFSHRWGAATKESAERIALWCGDAFGNQQVPQVPFGILFNADRKAVAFYAVDQIGDADLLADAALAEKDPRQTWNEVMPFPGRWFAPHRYPVANRLAMRLSDLGQDAAARQLHESGAPHRSYELCMKGFELLAADSLVLARQFFQKAISLDEKSALARVGFAQTLRSEGLKVLGGDAEAKKKRQELREEAISNFNFAMELDPTNAAATIGRSNVAIDSNQIAKATNLLKRFAKLQPDNYEVYAIIGRLLFQQNKTTEAAKWLVEAFNERPTLPHLAGDLGFLYLTVGEHRRGLPFLQLANRLQPSDHNIHRLLAEAYYLTGNYEESVELCERVVTHAPNRQRPAYLLAWQLATAPYERVRDVDRAIDIIKPIVKIFGDTSAAAIEIYAACLAEQNEFEDAVAYQKKAIALIRDSKADEDYSDAQLSGLRFRLQLYERGKPYRMSEAAETPLGVPGISR